MIPGCASLPPPMRRRPPRTNPYKEGAKLQKSVRPALAQSNRNCHLDLPPLGGSQPTSTHARPRLFTAHFTELAHNPSPPVPALGCSTQRPPPSPTLCTAEAVGAHPQLSHTAALRCSQQATLTISRVTARSPSVCAMGASALASRRAHPLRAVACRLADVRRRPERSRRTCAANPTVPTLRAKGVTPSPRACGRSACVA